MPCDPEELKHVPLFALLDDEETAVLAAQVDLEVFAPGSASTRWAIPAGTPTFCSQARSRSRPSTKITRRS